MKTAPWALFQSRALVLAIGAACVLATNARCSPNNAPGHTFKLTPDDGAAGNAFGVSVAICGNTVIVGSSLDGDNGQFSGSAYIFNTDTGKQIVKLTPEDAAAGDEFGHSVALSDNIALVGSYRDDVNGKNAGSAYLFDATTGRQIAKLTSDDGEAGDRFGRHVALSGNTALIGSSHDNDHGNNSGSVYLFNTTTGKQIAKLTPDDGAAGNWFGYSVAISGNTVIVGSPGDNDSTGSAYLFDATTSKQIAKLTPDEGAADTGFGWAVALSGTTAIIGCPGDNDNGPLSGSAYLFDTTNGTQIAKLTPTNGVANDRFGEAVALYGNTAIVGSRFNDQSGSAYLFDATTNKQIAKLTPTDGTADDGFGYSVALNGKTTLVASPGDDDKADDSGSVYLYATTIPD